MEPCAQSTICGFLGSTAALCASDTSSASVEDLDEDGWGVAATQTISCEAPEGSVAYTELEDCDDTDASVHPGAPDYCDDGVDADCDTSTPSGCFPYGEVSNILGAVLTTLRADTAAPRRLAALSPPP